MSRYKIAAYFTLYLKNQQQTEFGQLRVKESL